MFIYYLLFSIGGQCPLMLRFNVDCAGVDVLVKVIKLFVDLQGKVAKLNLF